MLTYDETTREKDVKLYDIGISMTRVEGQPTIAVELISTDAAEMLTAEYGKEYTEIHDKLIQDMQMMIENLANNLMHLEHSQNEENHKKN